MRVLVTGAAGFLGRQLCRHGIGAGLSVVGGYHRAAASIDGVEWVPLDVTDERAVDTTIAMARPDAIVHAAAALAGSLRPLPAATNWRTNAVAAATVARCAQRYGVRLVHVSSDSVHRGRSESYEDDAAPDPTFPYGAAKAAGEFAVGLLAPEAAIVRVSAIMSDGAAHSELADRERFMLDLAAGRATGVLFTDEVRCPVVVDDVAAACFELASGVQSGLLNVAGPNPMSWYEMGQLVVARHGGDPDRLVAATHESAGVVRPGRVVLDTTRARAVLRTELRSLREVYRRRSVAAGDPLG